MIGSIEIVDVNQKIYDGFNNFILSDDTKVFGKLLARSLLLDKVKEIPGDIVECGVFKGTGLLTFLKLKKYLLPNTHKKVIGFDYFKTESLLNNLSGSDKSLMSNLFNNRNFHHGNDFYLNLIEDIKLYGFKDYEFELVKGDVSFTSYEYLKNKPGFKISLLYLDLDIEKPTYDALNAFWDRISTGGMVVFDEYAYQSWSESAGVDKFCKERSLIVKSLNYICPTAYIQK